MDYGVFHHYPRIRGMAEERGYVADYTQPSDQLRYKYLISTEPNAKMGEVGHMASHNMS